MSRGALFLLSLCVLTLLPACAPKQLSGLGPAPEGYRAVLRPGIWALERVARDGSAMWIRTEEGDCKVFHHATFREVKGGLRVRTLDRILIPKPGYGCRLVLIIGRHRVDLPRPLGNDGIFGECVPGDETPDQRICALLSQAADR